MKWRPRDGAKVTDEIEELLAFYCYPAEHRIDPRTTNPDRVDLLPRSGTAHQGRQGARFKAAGIVTAFKLSEAAQAAAARSTLPIWSRSSERAPSSRRGSGGAV